MTPLPTTSCEPWPLYVDKSGYGKVNRKGWPAPKLAHRWTYEQVHGPIPLGMVVMHLCDNRSCVRLDHLQLGTQGDNLRMAYERGMPARGAALDPAAGGRASRGEKNNNAKLTEDDVRAIRLSSDGCVTLARRYGVTKATIVFIRNRRTWKHVA